MDIKKLLGSLNIDHLSKNEKRLVIGLLVLEGIILLITIVVIISLVFNKISSSLLSIQPTPTPKTQYLPVIISDAPTAQPTASAVPTDTPSPLSHIWVVVSIEENVTLDNGITADVATFKNSTNPEKEVRGYCVDPGLPTPNVGQEYFENEVDLFVPHTDDNSLILQRFQFIP